MTLRELVARARDKTRFSDLGKYIDFCKWYLEFVTDGLQATIVSQNENHYCFFQYKKDGYFNISRPINSRLMYGADDVAKIDTEFPRALDAVRDIDINDKNSREIIRRSIYTIQQTIGATLDGLPGAESNQARKVVGDLFERLIIFLINTIGVECSSETVRIQVRAEPDTECSMVYQRDLCLYMDKELKAVGSVKTSSKDRLDKIFLDKFLYCKLTATALPHIAIFLNDIQRRRTGQENRYGINSTFKAGHFKAYTIALNPLDGVYYCDIRPNMEADGFLKQHIRTIDCFFCSDVWSLIGASPKGI